MIKIKPKSNEDEGSGSPREQYLTKEPRVSRAPYGVAALLAGVFVYFKTFAAGNPETHAESGETAGKVGGEEQQAAADLKPEHGIEEQAQQEPLARGEDDETGSIPEKAAGRPGGSGLYQRALFFGEDDAIDYERLMAANSRRDGDAPSPISSLQPVNDNAPRRGSGDAPASGGRGGGGGGGGGDGGGGSSSSPNDSGLGTGPNEPARNRVPRVLGPIQLQELVNNRSFFIPLALLLTDASDPDDDALAIANLKASSGRLEAADGGILFTPAQGYLGPVTLTYSIHDGEDAVAQTASFQVVRPSPILGSEADDNLLGTAHADTIDGRDGHDNIDALAGDDVVDGGDGDDHIVAGAGNDIVYGGAGNDIIFGQDGNDLIFGGAGNDRIFGGAGDDLIFGEDGDDVILAGPGSDHVFAGPGADFVKGEEGADFLDGEAGPDQLFGDEGNDVIRDGGDADVVSGGPGDDLVLAAADGANDRYDGGQGDFDTLSYSEATLSITIDAANGIAQGEDIGEDAFENFEKVVAGQGDDRIIAGSDSLAMQGGGGDDCFEFTDPEPMSEPTTGGSPPRLVHEIRDLEVGDRIVVRTYEVRRSGDGDGTDDSDNSSGSSNSSDPFNAVYNEDERRPFRFRSEKHDDGSDHMYIDVINEGPDNAEDVAYSIDVYGNYRLYYQ